MRRISTGGFLVAACAAALAGPAPAQAGLSVKWANATPNKAYVDGARIGFEFKLGGSGTRDLRVDIVRVRSERVYTTVLKKVAAGSRRSVAWNGLNVLGKPAKRGRYAFKIRNAKGQTVSLKKVPGKRTVDLYPFIFPVRGAHQYGDGIGAPRKGHTHQGQDIFAGCGTRLLAPRGGRIQYRGFQGSAGNYVVLDLWHSKLDAVFMHLAKPATKAVGQKLRTGKPIGLVGQTGNARGCHLHFELWSAPGWYEGGHFINPTKKLRKWDSWS